jgi:anti-sigma factor RsiW
MNCSMDLNADLKAYVLGELSRQEQGNIENHVRGCQSCREELDRLNITRAALVSLQDQEIPRRIAFVTDRVFEPRWWQTIWRSGPVMGFASAALLAVAILAHAIVVHGFEQPAAVDAAQIEKRVESQLSSRVEAAVGAAVAQAQSRQAAEFAKVLDSTERQRKADLANFQQAAEYYQKQVGRLEVASNEGYGK